MVFNKYHPQVLEVVREFNCKTLDFSSKDCWFEASGHFHFSLLGHGLVRCNQPLVIQEMGA